MSKNYGFVISYDGRDDTAMLVQELQDQRLIEHPAGNSNVLQITESGRKQIKQFEIAHFRENLISKLQSKLV